MNSKPKHSCTELGVCQGRDPACFRCPRRETMVPKASWLLVALYLLMLGVAQHYDAQADKHEAVLAAKREAWAAGRAQGLADAANNLGSGPDLAKACTTWWFGGDAGRAAKAVAATCKHGVKS